MPAKYNTDRACKIIRSCNSGPKLRDYQREMRHLRIKGKSTTIKLEKAYWDILDDIAKRDGLTLPNLIVQLYEECKLVNPRNLTACLRVTCLKLLQPDT